MRLASLWRTERIGARDITAEEYDRVLAFLAGVDEYEKKKDKDKKGKGAGSGERISEIDAGAIPESVIPYRVFADGEI